EPAQVVERHPPSRAGPFNRSCAARWAGRLTWVKWRKRMHLLGSIGAERICASTRCVDKVVLDWYRAHGARWQTRMNAVLRAFRNAARQAAAAKGSRMPPRHDCAIAARPSG